jgi:hypothetical protein
VSTFQLFSAITLMLFRCVFFALDNVDGFKREFSLTDTSLKYPFAVHERVPVSMDWLSRLNIVFISLRTSRSNS